MWNSWCFWKTFCSLQKSVCQVYKSDFWTFLSLLFLGSFYARRVGKICSYSCYILLKEDKAFIIYLFIFKLIFKINLFIYFWLRWVFIAVCGLSLVAVSGGYSSLWCTGFSLRWLLLLRSTGSRRAGFSSCGSQGSRCAGFSSCGSQGSRAQAQ